MVLFHSNYMADIFRGMLGGLYEAHTEADLLREELTRFERVTVRCLFLFSMCVYIYQIDQFTIK